MWLVLRLTTILLPSARALVIKYRYGIKEFNVRIYVL